MSRNLVSIIIPTFNRAYILKDTLESVLAQTYANWECLIIDDGSTDLTIEIIENYIKLDTRFRLLYRPSERIKGASTCRNVGLENSKGEFIQFLDSDDIMSSNKLEEQVKLLSITNELAIATCKWGRFIKEMDDSVNFENFEAYNNFDDVPIFLEALSKSKGYFPIHAYLFKKELIKKSGLWNENLSLNDDTEFIIRVLCNSDVIYFTENTRVYYRWTKESNISSYNDYQKVDDAINSWKLIELYLKIRFKNRTINYVEFMKEGVYTNVNNRFPELTLKHKTFFEKQLKKSNLYFSIKKYLYQRFYKLLKKWS